MCVLPICIFYECTIWIRFAQTKYIKVHFSLKINLYFLTEKVYKEVKHSHDIWHAAKNLGKKLIAVSLYIPNFEVFVKVHTVTFYSFEILIFYFTSQAGQDKNCRELQKWSKDIVNHFWYTCKIANDLDEFMVRVVHFIDFYLSLCI